MILLRQRYISNFNDFQLCLEINSCFEFLKNPSFIEFKTLMDLISKSN